MSNDYPVNPDPEIDRFAAENVVIIDNTPNVFVKNPTVRKYAGIVLGIVGFMLTGGAIVDAAIEQIDLSYVINPATQITLGFAALFQLAVTTPNVPRK